MIAAMMDKDPLGRIQTMAEVVERLKPWATDVGGAAGGRISRTSIPCISIRLESFPGPMPEPSFELFGRRSERRAA